MKRILVVLGALVGVLVLTAVGLLAFTFAGGGPVEDGRELDGFVRIVKDGYTSASMLDLGDGRLALVDAGMDAEGAAILKELQRRGRSPDDVGAVLFTHGHDDHVGAAKLFQKAELVALDAEVGIVEGHEAATGLPGLLGAKPRGIWVTKPVKPGEKFTLGKRTVEVFAVPGHTRGSAAYLVDGVLFLGDSADATSDGKVRRAAWLFAGDVEQADRSTKALADAFRTRAGDLKWLVFAHSGVLAGAAPLLGYGQ